MGDGTVVGQNEIGEFRPTWGDYRKLVKRLRASFLAAPGATAGSPSSVNCQQGLRLAPTIDCHSVMPLPEPYRKRIHPIDDRQTIIRAVRRVRRQCRRDGLLVNWKAEWSIEPQL